MRRPWSIVALSALVISTASAQGSSAHSGRKPQQLFHIPFGATPTALGQIKCHDDCDDDCDVGLVFFDDSRLFVYDFTQENLKVVSDLGGRNRIAVLPGLKVRPAAGATLATGEIFLLVAPMVGRLPREAWQRFSLYRLSPNDTIWQVSSVVVPWIPIDGPAWSDGTLALRASPDGNALLLDGTGGTLSVFEDNHSVPNGRLVQSKRPTKVLGVDATKNFYRLGIASDWTVTIDRYSPNGRKLASLPLSPDRSPCHVSGDAYHVLMDGSFIRVVADSTGLTVSRYVID